MPLSATALRVVLVFVALSVAACQSPPRPFAPRAKLGPLSRVMTPGPRAVLVVPAVAGAPGATGRVLAARVAVALRDFDIGATTLAGTGPRYRLVGEAEARPVSDRHEVVTLRWRLVDPSGAVVDAVEQTEAVGRRAWREADPDTLDEIARRLGPRAARMLSPPAPGSVRPPLARVTVSPVDGAPGDGRTALARALREALGRYNVEVVGDGGAGDFVVAGRVRIEPRGPERRLVRIEWRVIRADGRRVGTVSQENLMPAGSLDGAWGPIAPAIAENGVEGLVQILRTVGGLGSDGRSQ